MLKIFFDSAITGHHTEYIAHLVTYITNDEKQLENYVFIVPEAIQEKFPEIVKLSKNSNKVSWEFIPNAKCDYLQNLPLYKRSFIELALVQEYATKFNTKEVFLLYFNIFQLALIFKRPSFEIKGILFLQFYRMQKNTALEKLKYYRKYWITKAYCLNPKIKKVYILNDTKTVSFLNTQFKTNKFQVLADPIPVYEEEHEFDAYKYYKIPRNKKILLHPGAIDPRKGTYEIIEAVDLLKDKETEEYAILIVGKAKADIERIVLEKITALKNKSFTIVFDNSFVSNDRLKSLFVQSFAVLMPYKNPEASSGILGHAVSSNKIVIAPKLGLIGDIIKEYKLGVLINIVCPDNLRKGIEKSHLFQTDKELNEDFIKIHLVENFIKTFEI
jgi:glycosyltransferase involved in cell wall biosynthesis